MIIEVHSINYLVLVKRWVKIATKNSVIHENAILRNKTVLEVDRNWIDVGPKGKAFDTLKLVLIILRYHPVL
jgi:hypothetical protein